MSIRPLTLEEQAAELKLLKLSNEKGKFAISLTERLLDDEQLAHERLMERGWVRLIDVSMIRAANGIFRIFLLSEDAREFLRIKTMS
jgi:hypothetical protein